MPVAVTVVAEGGSDAAASAGMTGSFEEEDEEKVVMVGSLGKADDHF
ncbi:hypothetical protein GCM10017779_46500 [Streptomyces capillispiralis]|nr:hypothetical protein GCM10017779_46500 [Streptomyces capillispiralis]